MSFELNISWHNTLLPSTYVVIIINIPNSNIFIHALVTMVTLYDTTLLHFLTLKKTGQVTFATKLMSPFYSL